MGQAARVQQPGEEFGCADRACADKHGPSLLVHLLDGVDNRGPLVARRAESTQRPRFPGDGSVGGDDGDGPGVDRLHLGGRVGGGAGHAAEERVRSEIPLKTHASQRFPVGGDFEAFLGFDRLVQPVLPRTVRQKAAGVLVDDDDLALDDLVLLLVDVAEASDEGLAHEFLAAAVGLPDPLAAVTEERSEHGAESVLPPALEVRSTMNMVDGKVRSLVEFGRHRRGLAVDLAHLVFPPRPGDDEGHDTFVDENGVRFIHERGTQSWNHRPGVGAAPREVHRVARRPWGVGASHADLVAEPIGNDLLGRAIHDGTGVHVETRVLLGFLRDGADFQQTTLVDGPAALGIACGEVVVDGQYMKVFVLPGDQGRGDRSGEGLAFTRKHLDDAAVVEGERARELNRVRLFACHAARDLPHGGQGATHRGIVLAAPEKDLAGAGDEVVESGLGRVAHFRSQGVCAACLILQRAQPMTAVTNDGADTRRDQVQPLGHHRPEPTASERFVEGVVLSQQHGMGGAGE